MKANCSSEQLGVLKMRGSIEFLSQQLECSSSRTERPTDNKYKLWMKFLNIKTL